MFRRSLASDLNRVISFLICLALIVPQPALVLISSPANAQPEGA